MARTARIPPLAWAFALVLGLLLFAAGLRLRDGAEPAPAAPAPEATTGEAAVSGQPPRAEGPTPGTDAAPEPAPAADRGDRVRGTIALVIDDVGRRVDRVDRFASLGVPVSFAVLPFESRSAEVARRVRELGAEMLVHLPMQGAAGADPGPGALMADMDLATLREQTRRALDALPDAIGVNNHMGSVLSADPQRMGAVLDVVAGRGLFFLDSRTSAQSVGFDAARRREIAAARRDVFLDSERDALAIDRQFSALLELASVAGAAVAIGHPYDETLEVLERRVPEALAAGYRFVPVSYLLVSAPPPES